MSAVAIIGRSELASAVATASAGLPKRPVVPVLAGMLVTVSAGTLELSTFDYETCVRLNVAADTDGTSAVLVPGKELAAAVKALPKTKGAQAFLTVSDEGLAIKCDGTETTLGMLPREEYPALPPMPDHAGDVDATAFAAMVGRVAACAGTDDTLLALTCVHFASDEGRLELAATDRYRLGIEGVSWTGADGLDVLVPAVQLTAFAKKMSRNGKVSVHYSGETPEGARVAFTDGSLTVMTRPNCGTFPKVSRHARGLGGDTTVITADAKALAAAVTRVGAMCERNAPVYLSLAGGKITLTARAGGGSGSTQAVRVTADGPEFDAAFSPVYLASLLNGIDGDARIGIVADPAPEPEASADATEADADAAEPEPVRLRVTKPATVRGGDFLGVVMPIRIQA